MEATVGHRAVDWDPRRSWAIAEIAVALSIGVVAMATASALGWTDPPRRAIAVAVAETLIVALIWWSQRRRGLTLADLGLTFSVPGLRTVGRDFGWSLVVFAGTAALFLTSAAVMSLIAGEPQSADVSGYDYLRGNYWAVFWTIAIVWFNSSFAEEVIYRGFMIHRLEEAFVGARHVIPIAVVGAGLIFGGIHYAWGPAGVLQTALVGIALGAAYVKLGRRLWIVILVHGYLDTALFVEIYRMGVVGN